MQLDPILLQSICPQLEMSQLECQIVTGDLTLNGQTIPLLGTDFVEQINPTVVPKTTPHILTAITNEVQCDECNKIFSNKSVLGKHKRRVHGQYKCDKCNRGFQTEILLEKHSQQHLGLRPFACGICANSFAEEGDLKTHQKR